MLSRQTLSLDLQVHDAVGRFDFFSFYLCGRGFVGGKMGRFGGALL